jgi:hypothetical protein
LSQRELEDLMANAYRLQETLKQERQQVRQHAEEYKDVMDRIVASKVRRQGKYEVVDTEVNRQHFIVSDRFRELWPDLFNQLAMVKVKDAKEVLEDKDLEKVWELKIVTKPIVIFHE